MLRSRPGRLATLPASVAFLGGAAACGDLVIPSNAVDAGDDGAQGGGDDGAAQDDSSRPPDASAPPDCTSEASSHPTALACTGLYADWSARAFAPDAHEYNPGLGEWSDGADVSRWVYLPPNARIDTANLNEWTFPVGTKLWQEFRLLGKRVETRFLWKVAPLYWFRTVYEWSEDESQANELTTGRANVRGLGYDIPNTDQCLNCHGGRRDFVLGYEIVGLATAQSTGFNLAVLRSQGLLTNVPANNPVVPGDANTAGAVGYLHANCGNSCHNRGPGAFGGASGLLMRLEVDATGALPPSVSQTDLWTTAYKVPSTWAPGGAAPGSFQRIKPQDAAHSSIPYRDGRRDPTSQMPPLGTHVVDAIDSKKVVDWINGLN